MKNALGLAAALLFTAVLTGGCASDSPTQSTSGSGEVILTEYAVRPGGAANITASRIVSVMPDGSNKRVLVDDATITALAPASGRMVYRRPVAADPYRIDLVVSNIDGSAAVTVVSEIIANTIAPQSTIAPNGGRIAYVTYGGDTVGAEQLWVCDADGGNKRWLFTGVSISDGISFSPDGSRIAFYGTFGDLYILRVDGSDTMRIDFESDRREPRAADDYYGTPAWSPEGSRIAFAGRTGSPLPPFEGLFVANVELNTAPMPLTTGGAPVWSPDGSRIAYLDGTNNEVELFTISINGTGRQQLTDTRDTTELFPQWSPDSRKLMVTASPTLFIGPIAVIDVDTRRSTIVADTCLRGFWKH